jgi:microcystin-dependent protein
MVCDLREKIQSLGVALGTIITFDANYLAQFLGVGSNGTVLTAASGEATGLKWETPATTPAGAITMYGAAAAPSGWLLCDGAAVSRTTYAGLFAVVGETYGAGDSSTTFNVPNLKGKFPVGLNAAEGEFDALAETGGEKTHTLTEAELASHNHTQNAHYHSVGRGATAGAEANYLATSSGSSTDYTSPFTTGCKALDATATNNTAGSGTAHQNLPPYITLQFIIKT